MKRAALVTAATLGVAILAPITAYQMGLSGVGDFSVARANPSDESAGETVSLEGATGWISSPPLSFPALRGKVVLVNFWTYTCINWRRQLPYVRAWSEKYRDHGLVVIGVHTPEFGFERDVDNVRRAVKEIHLDYPVAIDTDYAIWRAFGNEYWPALYLIDAQGRIRHRQFGEGEYEKTELILQELLAEASGKSVPRDTVLVDARGAESASDLANLSSPETYIGHDRTVNFESPEGLARSRARLYSMPEHLGLNRWALAGNWTVQGEAAILEKAGGRIAYTFHARDVHLVMGPMSKGTAVRFRVLIDGRAPGDSHGVDIDVQGNGIASEPRMYQLVRQRGPISNRRFEIEFLDPGIEAFSFAFG